MPAGSQINFRNAVTPASSNRPGDSGTTARLSGWLNYSYSSGNGDARVPLTANYSPLNGLAYSVEVSDPDNTPVANGEPTRAADSCAGLWTEGRRETAGSDHSPHVILTTTPPAMLMMRGADDCAAMTFDIGNSNAKDYSGHDRNGSGILPAFGSTCAGDYGHRAGF